MVFINNGELLLGLGPDQQASINLWKGKVGLAWVLIAIDDATIPEAGKRHTWRNLQEGFVVVPCAVALKRFQLVEVRLPDVVVQVAFPEDVFGSRPCLFSSFAFAFIISYELSRVQAVRGSDASANDALQKSVHLWVVAVGELEFVIVVGLALFGRVSKIG